MADTEEKTRLDISVHSIGEDSLRFYKAVAVTNTEAGNYSLRSGTNTWDGSRGLRVTEIALPADLATGRATTDLKLINTAYQRGIEYGERFIEGE